MNKKIEVVKYNNDWPGLFKDESSRLRNILGSSCLELHHIGSTAVPGLLAKNSIDIICVIDSLNNSLLLESKDFVYKGEYNIPLRYFFSKRTDMINVNLHVVEADNEFIKLNLCFRDYLMANEESRLSYNILKRNLLKKHTVNKKNAGGFSNYNHGKDEFIKDILSKSGFDGLSVNFCAHENEWNCYHKILTEEIFKPINIDYDNNHYSFSDTKYRHFILSKGVKVFSAAKIEFLFNDEVALRLIATDSSQRKKGYATYLLKVIEKWLLKNNCKKIRLHADPNEINFYKNHNYIEREFKDVSLVEGDIGMFKQLS